jgi:hypothetical protein
VRWWIEGVRINWELGVARLSGGYLSPVCQTFIQYCREHFSDAGATDEGSPRRSTKKRATKKSAAKKRRGKSKR